MLVADPCHAGWAEHLDALWAGEPIHSVLDLCCGTGLMAAELADRGMAVVGLDSSPAMLDLARSRLGPQVPLVEATLPALPVDGPFDAVVSTLDGLNYLTGPEFAATILAIARVLRPGGWLVFDIHAPAALDLMREHPVIAGEQDGSRFVLTSEVDDTAATCTTRIELSGPDQSFVEEHVQFFHADDLVRQSLAAAGLDVLAVTDEYSDAPLGETSLRATWVACRR